MPLLAIPFPAIDPVAISIGPFAIRWYALAYIVGLLIGWRYCLALAEPPARSRRPPGCRRFPRLGDARRRARRPHRLRAVLQAGLLSRCTRSRRSTSGTAACRFTAARSASRWRSCLFTRARRIPLLAFSDIIVEAIPIGLFFGRIANFVNGELYGRPSDVPWAMVFPNGGPVPRHPSQLYEAACEGVLLFLLLFAAERLGCAAPARPRHRLVSRRLCGRAHVGRAVPRARRAARLSGHWHDDGPAAVDPAAAGRDRRHRLELRRTRPS